MFSCLQDDGKYFDAVEYLTQCELDKHKPRRLASFSTTDDFSDDYDLNSAPDTPNTKLSAAPDFTPTRLGSWDTGGWTPHETRVDLKLENNFDGSLKF